MVTVIGPGGGGKTRLALEVARELGAATGKAQNAGAPFGGVAWASLTQLPSSRLVPGALLDALGARQCGETIASVAAAVQGAAAHSGQRVLLVIDNCEHLHGLPDVLARVLSAAPALVVLTTSRSPLQLSGERLFSLRPLPATAPANGSPTNGSPAIGGVAIGKVEVGDGGVSDGAVSDGGVSGVAMNDAMRLFIERAQLVQPRLDLSRPALRAIACICQSLGGLPLAIEVAAARVALFSPAQLAAELDGAAPQGEPLAPDAATALDWPNANADVPDRHRSLRATIAWSYAQLPGTSARLWAQLSVFRGSFSVEAVRAVCVGAPVAPLLLTLRDSSLLSLDSGRSPGQWPDEVGLGAPRGVWIESLRAFAAEQLSPAQTRELRARHAAHFLGWIEDLAPQLHGPQVAHLRARLEVEASNLRAMFAWFLEDDRDIEGALRACAALWLYWEFTGQIAESRAMLATTLEAAARVFPDPDSDAPVEGVLARQLGLRALCHEGAGKLAYFLADHEGAREHLGLALHLFRRVGDEVGAANCLYSLGFGALKSGDLESARRLCEQSLSIHRRRSQTQALGDALYNLSLVALMAGDYDAVRELSQERLVLHRASGDRRGVAISLENLGLAALFSGQVEAAAAYFVEALSSFEALNEAPSVVRSLWGLGQVERARGRNGEARAHFERALQLARETDNRWGYPYLMEAFGALAADAGQGERAARLMGGRRDLARPAGRTVALAPNARGVRGAMPERARPIGRRGVRGAVDAGPGDAARSVAGLDERAVSCGWRVVGCELRVGGL